MDDLPDLTTYDNDRLDRMRVAVLVEQERRATVASAPERIEQSAIEAIRAGADPAAIRAAVEAGITP